MKQRPILYSTQMVQGLLENRKTMTRRLNGLERMNETPDNWNPYVGDFRIDKKGRLNQKFFNTNGFSDHAICPYGKVGDLLWVKETIKLGAWRSDGRLAFDYKASPELTNTPWVRFIDDDGTRFNNLIERTCNQLHEKGILPDKTANYRWEPGKSPLNWTPSIHMPKAAARIWLKITNIRVERLQDISEEDSKAEGVEHYFRRFKEDCEEGAIIFKNYRDNSIYLNAIHSFRSLWIKINGKDSWKLNPWVWVIEFEKLELEHCESCGTQFPIEIMHCDEDANWFCPECWQALAPAMKAIYDEMVKNGEIEAQEE